MLKKIILTIAVLIVFLVLIMIWLDKAISPDPEYNTVYTENYTEEIFNDSLIGLTENELNDKIGKPFKKKRLNHFHSILYSVEDSISIEPYGYSVSNQSRSSFDPKFYRFEIDSLNNVEDVFTNDTLLNEFKYIGDKRDVLVSKLGNFRQEILCDCKCYLFEYSKIKDGPIHGKTINYHERLILLDSNKIVSNVYKINYRESKEDFINRVCETNTKN